mmetsp:Transcript_14445/g.28838  ORF Transcript_14445/g.28838 Transcript_14445/m.28838 type:complete len:114 (+) Transcript_14445:766-1107(+)
MQAVSSFKQGALTEAAGYLEACNKAWSAEGVLDKNTAYVQVLGDMADKIEAAGGPASSTLKRVEDSSRENYLKLANGCVEQASAAMDENDFSGASRWWDEAEMWYSAAELYDN